MGFVSLEKTIKNDSKKNIKTVENLASVVAHFVSILNTDSKKMEELEKIICSIKFEENFGKPDKPLEWVELFGPKSNLQIQNGDVEKKEKCEKVIELLGDKILSNIIPNIEENVDNLRFDFKNCILFSFCI